MMDVELLRSGSSRTSHNTVLWFEFLLNPSLLENHLKQISPDPSPTDLIVKFLSIAPDTKDGDTKANENEPQENGRSESLMAKRSHKYLALKILALKVAAFLKWDLGVLENKLPLPMQLMLLQDLLYLTLERDVEVESHLELGLGSCPGHVLFAVSLYHRWVLRAVKGSRLATKQARQPYIPIPGLQDPTYVPPNVSEELLRNLEAQVANSIAVLNHVIDLHIVPLVPILSTFVMLTEDSTDTKQNWDEGVSISLTEFLCQLHFDMGSFHFFQEVYSLAAEHISKATDLRNELANSEVLLYCTVSPEELRGYNEACDIICSSTTTHNLTYQLHRSIRDQYMGIVSILQADNICKEIPQVYRDTLELDIQGAMSSRKFTVARDLLLQVQTLNVVRRVITGTVTYGDYIHKLIGSGNKAVDLLINALRQILSQCSGTEKERIKLFLLQLVECGDIVNLPERLLSCGEIVELFSTLELDEISSKTEGAGKSDLAIPESLLKAGWDMPDFILKRNRRLEMGNLEQQLIVSYNPLEIKQILEKLIAANPMKPQWCVNNKWDIPIPLQGLVMSLPRGFVQDFIYILLSKSQELTSLKDFNTAAEFLHIVEQQARGATGIASNVLMKLCRLLSWETLLIRITQYLTEWPNYKLNTANLMADCKQCLAALQSGDSVIPRLEIREHCAICLLNLGEWDYLTALEKRWNYFELAAAIACACQDIMKYKGNKKVSRDAWDIVLPVFGPSPQQKRTSSGATTVIHRDSPTNTGSSHTRSSLSQFLSKLRDSTALNVMISLLVRLHNVLRDEPSLELSMDYASLWPAVVSNANSYNLRSVGEVLSQLLLQALQFHPKNVSWLKVMGDLNFVQGHHATSLKYYLEGAIVVSDFFSQPVPKTAIDDHIYKRMIKCCSHLQCHTQAAVLCQFLEDVDYTVAFKCLGDIKTSTCSDSMDSYYSCIWDTTILEYLVHLHSKRGEHHRKQKAIKVIGMLELNANNNEEIQREAANIRKSRFLRAMARQYVC